MRRLSTLSALIIALAAGPSLGIAQDAAATDEVDLFRDEVQPLLNRRCGKCHGPDRQRSGLRLDQVPSIELGGDRGALFDEAAPTTGLMFRAISYQDEELEMPPKGKLPDAELALLSRWIERGAPMPAAATPVGGEGDRSRDPSPDFDLEERSRAWAYQPLSQLEPGSLPPPSRDENSIASAQPRISKAIDRLIQNRLALEGLEPAAAADRRTLLRRLSFDLIGLPPTPAEIEAFLADEHPEAYVRQVDRLLASPHFGERWGRHWLDLMRYAETRGHEFDYLYPNAYQYRDYVLRAFNTDVPVDDLVREHIAGDLIDPQRVRPEDGALESILGTGFWFLGDEVHSPVDIRADETDRVAGKVDTLSKAFLGLTAACARCHDHKFDAITTEDYYALSGYAISGSYRPVRFETLAHNRSIAAELSVLRTQHAAGVRASVLDELPDRFARTRDYLLEAREVFVPSEESTREESPADPEVQELRALDPATVLAWVSHLDRAADDPADPFHALAMFVRMEDPAVERVLPWALRGLAAGERSRPEAQAPDLVVDYASEGPLLQNGFAFQWRAAGEAVLGVDETQSLVELAPRAAVYFDETWRRLASHPESEADSSALTWDQAGRTLRSETFVLEQPKLYYLVRGAGHVFASVDSHRMVKGPLHGSLLRSWGAADPAGSLASFRWIEHDLTDYVGHRVHVEFSPQFDAPRLGIAAIAQGTEVPRLVQSAELHGSLLASDPRTVTELANAYGDLLDEALASLPLSNPGPTLTACVNFLIAHPELGDETSSPMGPPSRAAEYGRLAAGCVERIRPVSRLAPAMLEGTGVDEPILIRGSHRSPGTIARRRFLEVFGGKRRPAPAPASSVASEPSGSERLQLAEEIIATPLFPRVFVNRAWHHLFGRGLVASADDFGRMGEEPSHPELLDFLATALRADDYSPKRLLRWLVCTDVYRRSGAATALALERDPTNRLWHYRPARRLSAEVIRDAVLAVSGRMDPSQFGPAIPLHLTDFLEGRGRPESGPLDGEGRRSVYLSVRRNFQVPLFAVFDFPSPAAPVGCRSVSNVPAQALALMNDPFVWEQAELWAESAIRDHPDGAARLHALFAQAFARVPARDEEQALLDFIKTAESEHPGAEDRERDAWRDACHVLLNTREFLFVP